MPSIVTITEENFKQEIYETRDVILLDLWAPWCAPCKTLSPIIDKLAALPSENLIVAKLDVEQYPEMMRRLGLRGIPALLVFKDGQEIARELGTKTLYQLKEWLTPYGVQFTESSAPAVDTPSFDAFYGDLQLKQFLFDRLKTHAQRAELQASPEPFWENGVGTPSAAMVHAADPVIFERITGLPTALAWALDFVGPYRPEDIQQLSDHLKLGKNLSFVPLKLIESFLQETTFDWAGLLRLSPSLEGLRKEWLRLVKHQLGSSPPIEQNYINLVARLKQLSATQDPAVTEVAKLIHAVSPPPHVSDTEAWTHIFILASDLLFPIAQHCCGWSLEDRQGEERRFNWLTEQEQRTPSGTFTDEEYGVFNELWSSQNEAYQIKGAAFFGDQTQSLRPIQDCMREHLVRILYSAPHINQG